MKNLLNRIFKIISSAIFVILIIIIVLILAYVIRVKYLASQGRLGEARLNFYTILTQSMVPTIYAGDVVVTYKNMDNKYQNGDILTFTSDINGGINITHRIKDTYVVNGKYSYKTKGDNNSTADNEIVKGERVLGKVVLKIPKIGFLQQFLTEKHRWIIVIVLPCLGIIIYDVIKIVKGFRKEESYELPEIANNKEDIGSNDFDLPEPMINNIEEQITSPNEEISAENKYETEENVEEPQKIIEEPEIEVPAEEEQEDNVHESDVISPVEIPKVLKPEEESKAIIETEAPVEEKQEEKLVDKTTQEMPKEDDEDIELL